MQQQEDIGFDGRINLVRAIHKRYRLYYRVGGLVLLFLFGLFYFKDGYTTNAYTEALSILVTVFWLNELAAISTKDMRAMIKELEKEMKKAAQSLEFEKAAALRDPLFDLRGALAEKQGSEGALVID